MSEFSATRADGPRLPVANRRVSPTESGEYVIRTDVVLIEEDEARAGIGVARLYEAPVTAYGGAGLLVKDYSTSESWNGALTWPPSNKTFFVAPYLGRVYFNQNQIGSRAAITYAGKGSLIDAVDINHINDKASSAASPYKQITVPANGQVVLQKEIALVAFGDIGGGVFSPNPSWCAIELHDPNDAEVYRSVIKNSSASAQVVLVKTLKHHEKDQ